MRHDAGQVARMLADRAADLARELQPAGHREGAEWVAPSVGGTSGRAWSMRITGGKAGVFGEFDSGARGDALDAVAHTRFRGDKRAAYRWALGWLGVTPGAPLPRPTAAPRPATPSPDAHDRATAAAALRLWLEGEAALRDTPADHYLRGRGINLTELGRQPRALRFHPACRNVEVRWDMPAMLAAICGPDGRHIATHRTWIAQHDGQWTKARLQAPKKVLGRFAGGTIRLWRGASGKPLAEAPETDTIVIAEGIENALSIALACPEYRVLAAVSLSNMGGLDLPPQALDLIVAADNDTDNPAAEAALHRAVDRLLAQGRSVRIARSSTGKDFNDAMKVPDGEA